jgi:hypothetical protein
MYGREWGATAISRRTQERVLRQARDTEKLEGAESHPSRMLSIPRSVGQSVGSSGGSSSVHSKRNSKTLNCLSDH